MTFEDECHYCHGNGLVEELDFEVCGCCDGSGVEPE